MTKSSPSTQVFNNGFKVKNDRFSITEPDQYFLRGWLAPMTELKAYLDKTEFPVKIDALTENVDERYGGREIKACFDFSGQLSDFEHLRVYACKENGKRHLCFEIGSGELREKKNEIKLFIDKVEVVPKDGMMQVLGWAVSCGKVEITVLDFEKHKLDCRIRRYLRLDVVSLFDEASVDPKNGFHIEIRPIPQKRIYLLFRCGDAHLVKKIDTGRFSAKTEKAVGLVKKGTEYFRYNGLAALVSKSYDRLFNPAMRPVIYEDWIRKHLPSDKVLAKQRAETFAVSPLISIVVPLYKTPEKYLRELVQSVQSQSYEKWELILSDGSGEGSPLTAVLRELSHADGRIHFLENEKQLRISENTNAAIDASKGELIAFCDHDDLLAPNALYEAVRLMNEKPDTELIYTDEDKIDIGGKYMQPNLKPNFNPDFLNSVNYICHLTIVKRTLIDRVGKLNPAFDGAQDYDFVLRCTENSPAIRHIPKVLYHWRFYEGSTAENPESKSYAFDAGQRALEAHFQRLGLPVTVKKGEYPGIYISDYHWDRQPTVTVMIPNKDHIADLKRCLDSIGAKSKYPNLQFLIIENNSTEDATFAYYEELKQKDARVKVVTYQGGFNYSAINNFGEQYADGEILFLLNNDTEFISADVIEQLLGFVMRPDVGAAGARLYYADETIQHAGVIVGWGGVAGHAFVNQKRGETGYQHRVICQQDMSAVTAACMMVKKSVFEEVGGFTEELAIAFNDIDFCMKIRKAGHLIVYNPYAELYHYESKSRGLENTPEKVSRFQNEVAYFQRVWPEILRDGDPYYNPNLSMVTQDFSLKHI